VLSLLDLQQTKLIFTVMALHIVFSSDTTHARHTSLKKYQKHAQGFAETEVTEVSSRLAHY
jgi:hypothetical protein